MKFLMNREVQMVGKVFAVATVLLAAQAYRTTKEVVVKTSECTQTATETLNGLIRWNYSTACPFTPPGLSETSKKLVESGKTPFVDQGSVTDRFLKND